jgi:hypothetical protein
MRVAIAVALIGGALVAAPTASSAPDACAALRGVVQDGLCQVQASGPAYTMNMKLPLDYPDQQAVIGYLTEARDGFVNVAQTPDSRNVPHEMDVTAESFRSAATRSLVLTLFQDVGGAHPTTWYKSFTYDLGRGRPVTFDTLFAADAKPLDAIFPIVQRTLDAETGLAASISPSDGRDPSHYQNFAITDDSVIFFFGRAELLPSYAGATSVSVPRNALPPLQV